MRGEDTLIGFDENHLNLIVAQLATNDTVVMDATESESVLGAVWCIVFSLWRVAYHYPVKSL